MATAFWLSFDLMYAFPYSFNASANSRWFLESTFLPISTTSTTNLFWLWSRLTLSLPAIYQRSPWRICNNIAYRLGLNSFLPIDPVCVKATEPSLWMVTKNKGFTYLLVIGTCQLVGCQTFLVFCW